jgi:hypothetical protein
MEKAPEKAPEKTPEKTAEQRPEKRTAKSSAKSPAKRKAASTLAAKTETIEKVAPRAHPTHVTHLEGIGRVAQSIEEEVRIRAYLLSLARGDRPGSPDADWLQAEWEVASSRQL